MYKGKVPLILSLILFVVILIPIYYLILGISFFKEIGAASFTFQQFFFSKEAAKILENTFVYAGGHAVFAVLLATVYAWIVARTDVRGKRILGLLPILGLTMPLEVKAFAWVFIFNPRNGIANVLLQFLFGHNAPSFDIYSMTGLIFAGSMGAIPLAYLIIMPAMQSLDSSLEEASRVAGKGALKTFFSVSARLVWPAILIGFILLLIGGIDNFDYPLIIGQPARISVLSTEIYFYTSDRVPPSYGDAAVVSSLLVMIALALVTLYILFTRRAYKYQALSSSATAKTVQRLGKWRPIALLICLVILFFEFALPLGTLVLLSMTTVYIPGGSVPWTFNFPAAYQQLTQLAGFYTSVTTTLEFALFAGAGATVIGAVLSYTALRTRSRGARLVEYISSVPLAFPGIVYGVALFWTFLLAPGVNVIYGTVWPLVISLIFIRIPYTTRIISSNLIQISDQLEEASQVSGARLTRTFRKVLMPLMRGGLINGFVYAFVNSMRELGGVVLLSTAAAPAFTTILLNFYGSHALVENVLSAGSVVLTLMIMAVLGALFIIERLWGGRVTRRARKNGGREAAPAPLVLTEPVAP